MITEAYKKKNFRKTEKLCSENSIERLFTTGSSFIAYPLRVVFSEEEYKDMTVAKQFTPLVLVSVSKKKFKLAVKRNRVKRLIREAYRLNKEKFTDLLIDQSLPIHIAFIYLKDELPSYIEIEKAIRKAAFLLSEKRKGN